jgi:hypothetical protein
VRSTAERQLALATPGAKFTRMKLASLEAALDAQPFLPFELRVDDEAIVVRHPEQVFLAGGKTTVIVDLGERIHICDVTAISKLTLLRRPSGRATKST